MRMVLVILCLFWSVSAQAACRQALALGLDVSGSVDKEEYRLQIDGLAAALLRQDVQDALFAFPGAPIRLFVFEWAGQNSRRVLVPWVDVVDRSRLEQITQDLRRQTRAKQDPATALGEAMQFGIDELSAQADCWRATLDLSGDGESNSGMRPRDLKSTVFLGDVTINGLVIGADDPGVGDQRQDEIGGLWAYYKTEVIHGPRAFIEVALGFTDFEAAMARKLLREMETLVVGGLKATP